MITAIVTAPIPPGMTYEQYARNVGEFAGRFRTVPGLTRKYFLFSEEQGRAGGVYLWETREAADACYAAGGSWRDNFVSVFGVEPDIVFFTSPVVVDNKVGEILKAG
jgi:hypothetical protein